MFHFSLVPFHSILLDFPLGDWFFFSFLMIFTESTNFRGLHNKMRHLLLFFPSRTQSSIFNSKPNILEIKVTNNVESKHFSEMMVIAVSWTHWKNDDDGEKKKPKTVFHFQYYFSQMNIEMIEKRNDEVQMSMISWFNEITKPTEAVGFISYANLNREM